MKKTNDLSTGHFVAILEHIKQSKSPLRETSELQEKLNVASPDLNVILQCVMLIYKESQRVIIKPTELQAQLVKYLELDAEKAEEFVKNWSEGVRNKFGNFEKQLKLSNFSWELDLETSSTFSSNTAKSSAKVQFEVDENEVVTLENLDEEAMRYLYSTLNIIQKKLDVINA